MDRKELEKLPGVGPKTAAVFLAHMGMDEIGVDVHVHRISNRLGLVHTSHPSETEKALKKAFPKKLWRRINKAMVGFGQTVCLPRNPKCYVCPLRDVCAHYRSSLTQR